MRLLGVVAGFVLTTGFTARTWAQQADGRFRLGIDGTVVNAESGTVSAEVGGVKTQAKYGTTYAGLFASGVGLVLGGGGENIVGGARVSFATQKQTLDYGAQASGVDESLTGESEQKQTAIALLPHWAYVFSPNSRVRFFLNATAGYQSSKSESGGQTTGTASGLLFGAGVGVLGFVTPRMSIDPALTVLRFSGSGKAGGVTSDYAGTLVMVTIGLSAWLGGSDALAPAAQVPTSDGSVPAPGGASVAEPEPEPEAEPEFVTRTTRQGVVTRGLRLESGTLIRLVGQPTKDGARVLVSVSVMETTPDGLGHWNECREGAVVSDGTRHPMELRSGKAGFGDTAVLRAPVRVGVVLAALRSNQAALDLCGAELVLDKPARRAILDFMRSFKTVADRYKTWDASLTAPTRVEPEFDQSPDPESAESEAAEPASQAPEEPPEAPPVPTPEE